MMKILVTDGMDRNAINNLVNEGFEVEMSRNNDTYLS